MLSDHAEGAVCAAMFDLEVEAIEAEAEAIYNGWIFEPGWVPWVPGGNSHKQDDARRQALAARESDESTS